MSLIYPNVEGCEIQITSSTGTKQLPPPSIDTKCLQATKEPLPKLYDFHIGEYLHVTHSSRPLLGGVSVFCVSECLVSSI